MLDKYTALYEATSSVIQQDKSYTYRWQWIIEKGKMKLIQLEVNLKIHEKNIKQYSNDTSSQILGVYINLELNLE